MKLSLKQIIAGSLLAAAASSPAFAFDAANTNNGGNGSLILTAFDTDAGKSVVVDLGLNYLDFLNNATAKDGRAGTDVTSDAGNILSWSIDLSVFGGNLSNVQWNVMAADVYTSTGFSATETLVTAALDQGPTGLGTNGDSVSMGNAYGNVYNQCTGAGMPSVCTGLDAGSSTFFGGDNWGTNFGGFLDVSGSASLNTALGFYGMGRSGNLSGNAAVIYQYANSAGVVAQWLLNSDGSLSYISAAVGGSTVPVPAAIWLLLSGLGGLGVIGRRRQVAA